MKEEIKVFISNNRKKELMEIAHIKNMTFKKYLELLINNL